MLLQVAAPAVVAPSCLMEVLQTHLQAAPSGVDLAWLRTVKLAYDA